MTSRGKDQDGPNKKNSIAPLFANFSKDERAFEKRSLMRLKVLVAKWVLYLEFNSF